MTFVRLTVECCNGARHAPVKVAWPFDCSDSRVEEIIAHAVGFPKCRVVLLDPTDGSFVPVCAQLPTGSLFRVVKKEPSPPDDLPWSTEAGGRDMGSGVGRRGDDLDQPLLHEAASDDTAHIRRLEERLIKFERMSSHLANERTFLAWTRTTVSVAGLAVTFSNLFDHPKQRALFFWVGSSFAWLAALAVFAVGVSRYQTVKAVLNMPKNAISNRFGRTGIVLIIVSFTVILCMMTIAYGEMLKEV